MAINNLNESKTDIAYRIMLKLAKAKKEKKEIDFYALWDKVKEELAKVCTPEQMEKVEDEISFFYTSLTLDGRFVQLKDKGKWSLREFVPSAEAIVDMGEFYKEQGDAESGELDEEEEHDEDDSSYVPSHEDESYDDSTGSDADVSLFRDEREINEDDE